VKGADRGSDMGRATEILAFGGEDAARRMETIVSQYETALLRYAGRILNNPLAAQDVVQNVFIKLFRSLGAGAGPIAELKAWLYRVTHNEAVDHVRREARLRLLHSKYESETQAECRDGRHCSATVNAERRQLVLEQLRRLSDREQQIVLLRLEEGLSYGEIAAVTGRTEGNVGNILHHAVKKLSARLKKAEVAS